MSLKTNFKDEILQEGETYRRYNIKNQEGSTVYANVHLERADTPQQVGDEFGSGTLNTMTTILNKVVEKGLFLK